MPTDKRNTLSAQQGLIQVVTAEMFQRKPRSGGNTQVVVMEKTGGGWRYYRTLTSSRDTFSIGEELWGQYLCYVVNLDSQKAHVEGEFKTIDPLTQVKILLTVEYHVVDVRKVTLGVEDALGTLRDELNKLLRREIETLTYAQVKEPFLEAKLNRDTALAADRLGLAVEAIHVEVRWSEDIMARLAQARDEWRSQKAEDEARKSQEGVEDHKRRRAEKMELEDVAHIDNLLRSMRMENAPPDMRLRLLAMDRKQALQEIIQWIASEREKFQVSNERRMAEEYEVLRKMIADGVLEDMDLVEYGRELVAKYRGRLALDNSGVSPELLFGEPPAANKKLGGGKKKSQSAEDQDEID